MCTTYTTSLTELECILSPESWNVTVFELFHLFYLAYERLIKFH